MKLFVILACIGIVLATRHCHDDPEPPQTYVFSNTRNSGPVFANWTTIYSTCHHASEPLDKPRVMPQPNTTSWSKWHFDAVNQNNSNESVAFTFVLGTEEALPEEGSKTGLVTAKIMFSFADGTTKEVKIDSGEGDAGKVVFQTDQYGSTATWGNTGTRWSGNGLADFPTYVVEIESEEHGVHGTLELVSTSTGRYPCVTVPYLSENTTLQIHPGLGWTNQIPAAKVIAHFTIRGDELRESTTLDFDNGLGYHDYFFGDRPYFSAVKLWQWGHAMMTSSSSMASYSLLWFQGADIAGKAFTGVYVEKAGKDAEARCADGDNEFLELEDNGAGTYVKIRIGSDLNVDLVIKKREVRPGRWVGPALATIEGSEWTGTGVVETLKSQ